MLAASLPLAAFVLAAALWPRSPHRAAGAGAAVAFAAAWFAGRGEAAGEAMLRSLWIAGPMSLVIVAGVALRDVAPPSVAVAATGEGDPRSSHRNLYTACFLLGPFFECAVGFGVGTMLALPFILAAGATGPRAVAFGMLAQSFVPWGALAIGTMASASFAGVPPLDLGIAAAASTAWLLPAFLLVFWFLLRGRPVPVLQRVEDAVWLAATWAAVRLAGEILTPDIAGIVAIGAVLAVRGSLDGVRPSARLWRVYWPYIVLAPLLACVRLIAPLADALKSLAVPTAAGLGDYAPLHHASFWLAAVALAACAAARRDPFAVAAAACVTARTALIAGFAFILFGEMLARPGFAATLVEAAQGVAGAHALLVAPALAAFGGAMTGSALAANAMALPLTLPLWGDAALDGTGLQAAVASAFTALSPSRVALAASLAGVAGGLAAAYRALVPLAVSLSLASLAAFYASGV